MNQIPHSHPLDKLISDDRLFLLEAILPFVEGPMRMPLVIYLKMMELQQIMRVINNQSYIRQCDFNRDLHNQNDILASVWLSGYRRSDEKYAAGNEYDAGYECHEPDRF